MILISTLHMYIFKKIAGISSPKEQPSACFINFPLTGNTNPFVNLPKFFLNIDLLHKGQISFL